MSEMTFDDQPHPNPSWAGRQKPSPELGYRSVRALIAVSGQGEYASEVRTHVNHVFTQLKDTTVAGALKDFGAAHATYEDLAEKYPDHALYRAIADGMDTVREALAQTIAQMQAVAR